MSAVEQSKKEEKQRRAQERVQSRVDREKMRYVNRLLGFHLLGVGGEYGEKISPLYLQVPPFPSLPSHPYQLYGKPQSDNYRNQHCYENSILNVVHFQTWCYIILLYCKKKWVWLFPCISPQIIISR